MIWNYRRGFHEDADNITEEALHKFIDDIESGKLKGTPAQTIPQEDHEDGDGYGEQMYDRQLEL